MAKTKGQLISKIDYLFIDIQSQYTEIKKSVDIDVVDVTLLEANLASLAKHIEALKLQTQVANSFSSEPRTEERTIFTPPTEISKAVDTQDVYEEINEDVTVSHDTKQAEFAFNINEISSIASKEEDPIESTDEISEVEVEVENQNITESEGEVVIPVTQEAKEIEIPVNQSNLATEDAPSRPLTINELIQQQKQAGVNVTQQFQTSTAKEKVVDLKTAVSLNDKLLYIKDLFNGYSLAYSEAVELLNRFDSFAEADAFLQSNYALKNGWAEKSQTVDKFYALLHKKFDA